MEIRRAGPALSAGARRFEEGSGEPSARPRPVLILNANEIHALVPMAAAVESMRAAFSGEKAQSGREIVTLPAGAAAPGQASDEPLLLFMHAFEPAGRGVVKLSTVGSGNRALGLPSIQGVVILFSAQGTPVAVLDGPAVTRIRTAATSALASTYLSRSDSSTLAVLGTGDLAPSMVRAHCAVRPITRVSIWGRNASLAEATMARLRPQLDPAIDLKVSLDLEETVGSADIVSAATSAHEPVLRGQWLRPGTFVDLVGSFSPSRREADDETIARSRVFVDTLDGALKEAGDVLIPLRSKAVAADHIKGDLASLVQGRTVGRTSAREITLFKSVGAALEDLALAQLIAARAHAAPYGLREVSGGVPSGDP